MLEFRVARGITNANRPVSISGGSGFSERRQVGHVPKGDRRLWPRGGKLFRQAQWRDDTGDADQKQREELQPREGSESPTNGIARSSIGAQDAGPV